MFAQDERRIRYSECLDLEAQYGQFLPCEAYEDPDNLNVDSRPNAAAGLLAVRRQSE
jgi:hypothetical protein